MSTRTSDPVQFDLGRAWTHLRRALLLRCPNCGGGPIFRRWVVTEEACPDCHLQLDRGEADYFIGGYTVNFVVAEFTIAAGAVAAVLLTWPEVPWNTIKWALIAFMIPFPIFTYPWSKSLWLAIDLIFRPLTLLDIEAHGENLD